MLNRSMAKNPNRHPSGPSAPVVKRPRGRPPSPGGPKSQAEIQRAYRARLAAAGKVVRIADTATVVPAPVNVAPGVIPDFDPATQFVCDRETFAGMRDRLHNALSKLERREQDVARLEARNAYLEGELKLQERHHTSTLKEVILLRQAAAGQPTPRVRRRTSTPG
jgi:hypothetical protein